MLLILVVHLWETNIFYQFGKINLVPEVFWPLDIGVLSMAEVAAALLDLARKLCKYAHSSKCTIKMAYQMINGAHKHPFFPLLPESPAASIAP